MRLVFLYGPAAAGKLTIGRALADLTGFALFHNHLVVDALCAVFPFGSDPFRRLREQWWLGALDEAAQAGRSLIFTFAPEPTVTPTFPARVKALVEAAGGQVVFVRLDVPVDEQERRIVAAERLRTSSCARSSCCARSHPRLRLRWRRCRSRRSRSRRTSSRPSRGRTRIAALLASG